MAKLYSVSGRRIAIWRTRRTGCSRCALMDDEILFTVESAALSEEDWLSGVIPPAVA